MIVADVMSKTPIFINPDVSLTEAKALMTKEKISKLPILDKNNKLVGIVTKNDLQKAAPSAATTLDIYEVGYLLSKLKVEKIMSKPVISVNVGELIEEAARMMTDNKIGCLPVMKDGILAGIITETDLFRAFIEMFGARYKGVRIEIEIAEKPGEIAKISQHIAEQNGNIVSIVTREGSDVTKRFITMRITNVGIDSVRQILTADKIKVFDIREV